MPDPDYATHLAQLGIDADALVEKDDGTLAGPQLQPRSTPGMELPHLTVADPNLPGTTGDLVLEAKLAEGGMGQIWTATQTTLARRVAVKRVRGDRAASRQQLVQEGRTLGSLEHPNIVPVHVLGRTDAAEPLVVMKYIEGTTWTELLVPLYPPEGAVADDVIERHLGILIQVCHALEFAHARGVLHRDLKPENVMIGAFGEVYVLDWGLAVSLREGAEAPPAKEVRTLAGTPACMAPEMAACAGERLDVRTDVYLLGAALHRLVTGRARHEATEPIRRLELAYHSRPVSYGSSVPRELADLCNRATHLDPDRRHPDVQSFRVAIHAFLRHRTSGSLVADVMPRLDRLADALATSDPTAALAPGNVDALLGEAEFGLQQALRSWPENPQAKDGLHRLRELAIELELLREHPQRARMLLDELADPRPDLRTRVNALESEMMRRQGAMLSLQRLRHDNDLSVTVGSRRVIALVFGSLLGISLITLFVLRVLGLHQPGYLDAIVVTGGLSIASLVARARMTRAHANRVTYLIGGAVTLNSIGITFQLMVAWWFAVEFSAALAMVMVTTGVASLLTSVVIDRRLLWTTGIFFLTAVGVALVPHLRGLVLGVGCFAAFGAGAWVWRKLDGAEEVAGA